MSMMELMFGWIEVGIPNRQIYEWRTYVLQPAQDVDLFHQSAQVVPIFPRLDDLASDLTPLTRVHGEMHSRERPATECVRHDEVVARYH